MNSKTVKLIRKFCYAQNQEATPEYVEGYIKKAKEEFKKMNHFEKTKLMKDMKKYCKDNGELINKGKENVKNVLAQRENEKIEKRKKAEAWVKEQIAKAKKQAEAKGKKVEEKKDGTLVVK